MKPRSRKTLTGQIFPPSCHQYSNNSHRESQDVIESLESIFSDNELHIEKDTLPQSRHRNPRIEHRSNHKRNVTELSEYIRKCLAGQNLYDFTKSKDICKSSPNVSMLTITDSEKLWNMETVGYDNNPLLYHEVLANIPFEYREPNLYKQLDSEDDFEQPLRKVRKDSWSSTSSDEFNSKWYTKALQNHEKKLVDKTKCHVKGNEDLSEYCNDKKNLYNNLKKKWIECFNQMKYEEILMYKKKIERLPNWMSMLPTKKKSKESSTKLPHKFATPISKDNVIGKDEIIWNKVKADTHVSRLFREMTSKDKETAPKKTKKPQMRKGDLLSRSRSSNDCVCKKHSDDIYVQDNYLDKKNYPTIIQINNQNNKNPPFKKNVSDEKAKSNLSKKFKNKFMKRQDSKKSENLIDEVESDNTDSPITNPFHDQTDHTTKRQSKSRGSIAPTRRKSSWMADRMKVFEEDLKHAELTDWSSFTSENYRNEFLKAFEEAKSGPSPNKRKDIHECTNQTANVWNVLKNNVAKDFTKIALPVNYNEPLSMLQRITEDFCYANLLHKAADKKSSMEQMIYVAAFSMSKYAFSYSRMRKPFNPLLGETFEFDQLKERGWRSIAEQVSHHPPIAAQFVEAEKWSAWQESSVEFKFNGRSLQITPLGTCHILFHSSGNHYTYNNCTVFVQNLLVGSHWLDYGGLTEILNHTTGELTHLYFHSHSVFNKQNYKKVSGCVGDSNGNIKYIMRGVVDEVLEGCWVTPDEAAQISGAESSKIKDILNTRDYENIEVIWSHNAMMPANSDKIYNFNKLSIELNAPVENVAPTDCRLRHDIRYMEEGYWDLSNKVKVMLEDHQRERARLGRRMPKWFKLAIDPLKNVPIHVFTGEYWNYKAKNNWADIVGIFTLTDEQKEEIVRLKSLVKVRSNTSNS